MRQHLRADLRWLVTRRLAGPTGTWIMAVALVPLPLPWWARLTFGAAAALGALARWQRQLTRRDGRP